MTLEVFNALVFWFPAFLFSATVHEAAHAWAARRGGDPTAWLAGQVSLSPWPHVKRSPLGMFIVPLVSSLAQGWTIGWASAPIDRAWAERHPRRAALMAAAGPAGNLAIALVAFGLLRAGLVTGLFAPATSLRMDQLVVAAVPADPMGACAFWARALSVLVVLNTLLAAFNLLPLPPLDGASVVTLALPGPIARRVRRLHATPGVAFVGLLAAWRLCPMLTQPVLEFVASRLLPGR